MKVIGKIPHNGNKYGGGRIVQLTLEESRSLENLLNVQDGEIYDQWQHSEDALNEMDKEISIKAVIDMMLLFCDTKRSANQFNRVFNEFEKLVGGIG